MWGFLATLPLFAQISIPLSIVIVVMVIALWGKVNIEWGRNSIGFGHSKKRTCKDCLSLIFSKREEFETRRDTLDCSILRNQMNFAEHKLESILFNLTEDYRQQLVSMRGNDIDRDTEYIQCALYEEVVRHSLNVAKDEIRRSFKENGFHELSGLEFQNYVKNKTTDLLNRSRSYLIHRYPHNMLISLDDRLNSLDASKMEDICFDIYVNAKDTRIRVEKEKTTLQENYINEIYTLLGVDKDAKIQ